MWPTNHPGWRAEPTQADKDWFRRPVCLGGGFFNVRFIFLFFFANLFKCYFLLAHFVWEEAFSIWAFIITLRVAPHKKSTVQMDIAQIITFWENIHNCDHFLRRTFCQDFESACYCNTSLNCVLFQRNHCSQLRTPLWGLGPGETRDLIHIVKISTTKKVLQISALQHFTKNAIQCL